MYCKLVESYNKYIRDTLTLGDSVNNQVLTRERFIGQIGQNKKKIYTKSLSVKYLYLLLEDENKSKVGKTIIIVK